MTEIWDKFDHIYCIHYLPYTKRLPIIKSELSRISLLENKNFEFYYTVPNTVYNYIFRSDKNFKDPNNLELIRAKNPSVTSIDHPSYTNSNIDYRVLMSSNINLLKNMYDLMVNILTFGYENVLLIEDDVFFLNNLEELNNYLSNIPDGYDIINFDPFIYNPNLYHPSKINEYYVDVSKSELYNASFIYLNRKAIEKNINWLNKMLLPWDNYITYKGMENDDLKRCIPVKNLCIQRDYSERQQYWNLNTRNDKYRYMKNLNFREYAFGDLADVEKI